MHNFASNKTSYLRAKALFWYPPRMEFEFLSQRQSALNFACVRVRKLNGKCFLLPQTYHLSNTQLFKGSWVFGRASLSRLFFLLSLSSFLFCRLFISFRLLVGLKTKTFTLYTFCSAWETCAICKIIEIIDVMRIANLMVASEAEGVRKVSAKVKYSKLLVSRIAWNRCEGNVLISLLRVAKDFLQRERRVLCVPFDGSFSDRGYGKWCKQMRENFGWIQLQIKLVSIRSLRFNVYLLISRVFLAHSYVTCKINFLNNFYFSKVSVHMSDRVSWRV